MTLNHQSDSYYGKVNEEEALMGVHLNNSYLLHSRVAWRPTAWREISQQVTGDVIVPLGTELILLNQEVTDEVCHVLDNSILLAAVKNNAFQLSQTKTMQIFIFLLIIQYTILNR